jgi:hypothetical protein
VSPNSLPISPKGGEYAGIERAISVRYFENPQLVRQIQNGAIEEWKMPGGLHPVQISLQPISGDVLLHSHCQRESIGIFLTTFPGLTVLHAHLAGTYLQCLESPHFLARSSD